MAKQVYDEEINLREYLMVLRRRWKIIAFITLGLTVLALVFSLRQQPVYVAGATILIRSGGSSSFSQFSNLAGLAGVNLQASGSSLDDLMAVLQSKAVAAKVLKDLKLRERISGWEDTQIPQSNLAGAVQGMLLKPKAKGNLIELKVGYTDPKLAAEIANGFASALSYYWNKLNYTAAKKKKDYIEGQLPRVEKDLKRAEQKLKRYTLLSPKGASALGGVIGASQTQGIEVARLYRDLEIQNSVYVMLRKEYESVKLEESKEIQPFSVVDPAVTPRAKTSPKTKRNTVVGLVAGLFCGTFLAFFREYWDKGQAS